MAARRHSPKGEEAKKRIAAEAEKLFSESGLHGTRVREIAAALKMPLASLLHHFPTKEQLYSAVLADIAAQLEKTLDTAADGGGGAHARLRRMILGFISWTAYHPRRSNLLVRELLDNPSRVSRAGHLHLEPFLSKFAAFVRAGQSSGQLGPGDPVLFVLHLAGAASYFRAAVPTLTRIYGKKRSSALVRGHPRELAALAEAALAPAPRTSRTRQRGRT